MAKTSAPFAVIQFTGSLPISRAEALEFARDAMDEHASRNKRSGVKTALLYQEAHEQNLDVGTHLGDDLLRKLVSIMDRTVESIKSVHDMDTFVTNFDEGRDGKDSKPSCFAVSPTVRKNLEAFWLRKDVIAIVTKAVEAGRQAITAEEQEQSIEDAIMLLESSGYSVVRAVKKAAKAKK